MKLKLILLLLIICLFNSLQAQVKAIANPDKLANTISEYYALDRENIHLHLNKSIYLTEEYIWFKGYIIEKKSKLPYAKTSNVYVKLYDANGLKIDSKLLLAENSTFEGNIKLDSKLTSGIYYLQSYTNYMNNFFEDESNISKIEIINANDEKYISPKKVNLNSINMSFFVEGETFLEGVKNIISVKVEDCNGNGVIINDAEITDDTNATLTTFSTDQFGFGKFEINNTKNTQYKLLYVLNEKKIIKNLPNVILNGYALQVNNYSLAGKTIVRLTTNARTLALNKDKKLNLIIQQNDAFLNSDIIFKENQTEETIVLANDQIPNGLNSVFIIDENLMKFNERIFFKPEANLNPTTFNIAQKRNNKIEINGISDLKNADISISVLPVETISDQTKNTIYDSHIFNNYLSKNIKRASYFASNINRAKHAQLDCQLICSESKYKFDKLVSNTTKEKFEFDQGVTIKGTINGQVDFKKDKINMTSIVYNLNEEAEINEKNEYIFRNIIVLDSASIHFSLIDKKGNRKKLQQYGQVMNNNNPFLKPLAVENEPCIFYKTKSEDIKYPKLKNTINLDSILVQGKTKKNTQSNKPIFGGSFGKRIKFDDNLAKSYIDLLTFITLNGYNVLNNGINIRITTRTARTLLGSNEVAVSLNNTPIDPDLLATINISDIDEVIFNKSGAGGGSNAANGLIAIFTKKNIESKKIFNIASQALLVTKGFQKNKSFQNLPYDGYENEGFQNFGTIHWEPRVKTDERGVFQLSIPDLNRKAVQINIEGISSDGKIISESIILNIK